MLQNTTQHTASRATTLAASDANASVVRLEWYLILSNPEQAWRWPIVFAAMKGWMVRSLMRTEKFQNLVTTIRDARNFLADLR